jgi:hypothetical protein
MKRPFRRLNLPDLKKRLAPKRADHIGNRLGRFVGLRAGGWGETPRENNQECQFRSCVTQQHFWNLLNYTRVA